MKKYASIKTVFDRDPENKYKTLIEGQYALPEFEYLKDNTWVFTEKIDGTNIRVMWDGGFVKFGGRTDKAQVPTFLLMKLMEHFEDGHEMFLAAFEEPMDVCLYGEGYGARIQKGGGNYIPNGVGFILFDVKIGDAWLERHNVEDITEKLSLDIVPIVGGGSLQDGVEFVREGFTSRIAQTEVLAEGLVMRPKVELLTRRGQRVITKIKHKDFPK